MKIVPIGHKAANEYIAAHHRHHKPVRGCKFCVSVENDNGECCGVVICGRPISRYLDNGTTLDCFYATTGEFMAREFNYRVPNMLPKMSYIDSFIVSDCAEEVGILRSMMKSNVRKTA